MQGYPVFFECRTSNLGGIRMSNGVHISQKNLTRNLLKTHILYDIGREFENDNGVDGCL